jgi:predicted Zn-dependent peptidase
VAFANKNFGQNYSLIYKRQGEDKNVAKVEKPKITPIKLNRTDESAFQQNFKKIASGALTPKFIDFKKDIANSKLPSGVGFDYIHNSLNPTFDLYYTLDMGKNHDRTLPIAIKLLPYLGTDKYTADQLQQEFFKLGLSFDVFSSDDRVYVNLNGLEESFEEGVKLFEHILQNVQPDQTSLDNVVADVLKSRYDALNDKRTILRAGMANYAKYGKTSAFTDNISEEDLKKLKAADMVAKIKSITSFEHTIFYYGTKTNDDAKKIVAKHHITPAKLTPVPAETKYPEVATDKNKVLFVNFPMVQAELMMMSKGEKYDVNKKVMADLYNDYFGSGLSSIMFQEIREAKALAYSTFAQYAAPQYADRSHYMMAYVGTQVDKLQEAVKSVQTIVNEMPVSAAQIENARGSIMKKIESERITKSAIYWTYQNAKKLGLDHDVRSDAYAKMKVVTPEELVKFQQENVKGRTYTFLVLGDKTKVDMAYLKTIGEVEELSLKDVFGYARP